MRASLIALLALAACATASDVVVLTTQNFEEIVNNNPFVLVEFFAPWCGHCKKLAPEYEAAATALKGENVILASVDATVEPDLAGKWGVRGYPTLKLFKSGTATEYKGGRTRDTIISYLRKATGPAARLISSAEELATAKDSKVAVVGFFSSEESEEYKEFVAVASADDNLAYFYSTSADLAASQDLSIPAVVLFKKFDEGKNVFSGPFARASLTAFAAEKSVPMVIPFTMEAANSVFQSKVGQSVLLFTDEPSEAFNTLAASEYRGKFVFSTIDSKQSRVLSHFGVEKSQYPLFIVVKTEAQMKKYILNDTPNLENMQAFIASYLAGIIKPTYKSAEPPATNDGPVKVVVSKTFDELVLASDKDVLLEVYAPWCGHCKNLEPIYVQLGEAFKNHKSVVIAKMDGTDNEVEGLAVRGFPTIKFFKRGQGKTAAGAADYKDGRDLESFTKFLNQHAGPVEDSRDEL